MNAIDSTSPTAAVPAGRRGGRLRAAAEHLLLSEAADVRAAAAALAEGAVVGYGFANFYALTSRPDAATVRKVNAMKGRPVDQVGSVTTIPARIPRVYDWSALPQPLTRRSVLGLMDALFALGPCGFRGPAGAQVPEHLTQQDGGVRTAQVIAPGYRCPSNAFLAAALAATGGDLLYITSANRSRHRTGAPEEPAHYRAVGLRADFGEHPGFVLLAHADEAAARGGHPLHAPMSTTVLDFHRLADGGGERPRLVVSRHGSLPLRILGTVADRLGFDVVLGPRAATRLQQRRYAGTPRSPSSS